MGQPVLHFEIGGKDGKKLQDFYAKLFDWKVDANNPMNYGMVDTGGQGGINGGIYAAEGEDRGGVRVYVQADDLQAYLDKAASLGGRTIMPPSQIPDGPMIAMFADPEGNVTGLIKGM
ncbi:MAG TPA: VOC family protein [Chloroflexota bacterium]|nr:VOC family protein [Chloroflexota bacterium]